MSPSSAHRLSTPQRVPAKTPSDATAANTPAMGVAVASLLALPFWVGVILVVRSLL